MRTTKVLAVSVPPEMENEIQKLAKAEHRIVSGLLFGGLDLLSLKRYRLIDILSFRQFLSQI